MELEDQAILQNKPNRVLNQLWLKSMKSWESLQNVQSLCNQLPQCDVSVHLSILLESLWSSLNNIYSTNGDFDLSKLDSYLEKTHQKSLPNHLDYFRNLMNFMNKHSDNNPRDLFVGFKLNTMNQIENDMKKIIDFVDHSRIIKNPLTPKNVETSFLPDDMDKIYDDHDFFQNIAGDMLNKVSDAKSKNLKMDPFLFGEDVRSHKDRLIDYRVHSKIRNFATPIPKSDILLDEIRDETLSNLFQSIKKY